MGDLNYRLIGNDSIDDLMIRELASGGHIDELKKLDQVGTKDHSTLRNYHVEDISPSA